MRGKKGQAAMEFLMTYGWAILVVIAAIAALAYFGVLDPARLLPERCQFPAGMDCIDKPVIWSSGSMVVALRNNVGFQISIDDLAVSSGGITCTTDYIAVGSAPGFTLLAGDIVANNEVFRVNMSGCTGLNTGERFDGEILVTYTNQESNLQNTAAGDVRGRII